MKNVTQKELKKFIMSKLLRAPRLCLPRSSRKCDEMMNDDQTTSFRPGLYIVEVVPGLFMGDLSTSQNFTILREKKIDVIINLCAKNEERVTCDEIQYIDFKLSDREDFEILGHFDHICSLIHEKIEQNQKVFVHCQKGISRSPTIMMAYMIRYQQTGYENAFDQLKKLSPNVGPNFSFLLDLQTYEKLTLPKTQPPFIVS